jgi:hypothetical protein
MNFYVSKKEVKNTTTTSGSMPSQLKANSDLVKIKTQT